jgi:hypothetical protein
MTFMPAIRKYAFVAVVAAVSGFLGSAIHGWTQPKRGVVRGERFELIDRSGHVVSFWGPDIERRTQSDVVLVFMDANRTRRSEFGSGRIALYDKDGPSPPGKPFETWAEPRLFLGLGFNDDPLLLMHDDRGVRVFLGADHGDAPSVKDDDWKIVFRSRTRARAGLGTRGVDSRQSSAWVSVNDEEGNNWSMPPEIQKAR